MILPREPITSLDQLVGEARKIGGKPRVAIAPCADDFTIRCAVHAFEENLAEPLFIGDIERTRSIASEIGLDINRFECIDQVDDVHAVSTAVQCYREGRACLIMKGMVSTSVVLKALLDKEKGVPPKGIMSHITVFPAPGCERLMIMSDAGVNIKPNLQRKVEIVRNAVDLARRLGMVSPRVAMLAATEKVNYPAMPATLDADVVAKMAAQGEFGDARVCGPLALDLAVSAEAAACKCVENEVAGCADILCTPDIESGNILYKALTAIARLPLASVVAGSEAPVVVPSRGDSEMSKFYSIALAVYLSNKETG